MGRETLLVDPFSGGTPLSDEEAFARSSRAMGEAVEPSRELLKPITHHMWLFRMLNNLEICFHQAGRGDDQVAMRELKAILYRG